MTQLRNCIKPLPECVGLWRDTQLSRRRPLLSRQPCLLQGPTIKPQLMTGSGMLAQTAQQDQQAQSTGPTPVSPGQQITSAQPYQTDTSTTTGKATTTVNVGGKTITINVSSPVLMQFC